MNKKSFPVVLISFCFIFFTYVSFAQTSSLGIKGGISIPSLKAGDSDNPINSGYSSRLGPDFAAFAEFSFSKLFSLQPQIEYSSQGGKKNGVQAFPTPPAFAQMFPPGQAPQYLYASYKSEAKINYLMIPILAKFRFNIGNSFCFYAGGGPFVSFVISAKNITKGSSNVYADKGQMQQLTPNPQSFDNNENVKDDLHKSNVGAEAVAGLTYHLGNSEIFIEGGGNYGFIKIQKDKGNGQNNTGAGMVTIGYAFKLKK